ncbi:MAG TPA: cytochrome c peroxidase [Labilithrix sp.]|nr:cytochrome c peroxidase [Labilithrix sp.]
MTRVATFLLLPSLLCGLLQGCGSDGGGASVDRPVSSGPEAPPPVRCDEARPLAPDALPALSWEGFGEGGEPRTLALRQYHEPCADRSRVLVVRVNGGSWCGTCRWHAAHTAELRAIGPAARLRWLDLVVGDADNAPASVTDLPAWRALVDAPAGMALGADPTFALRSAGPEAGVLLPFYVLVDTRTMRVRGTVSNPDVAMLATLLDRTVAELDGAPPPAPHQEALADGLFRRNDWDMIRDVAGARAPLPDPTNAAADDARAATLGKALFFDTGLSATNAVSCATCHDPAKQLSDGRPTAVGLGPGSRKTPRIALAALARWQLWDGRSDTLWGQALGPLENRDEIGSSRVAVVRRLLETQRDALLAAFPGLPLPDLAALPLAGKPGDAAYDALPAADRDGVTRVFVAAGKAIAAYERSFRVAPNALDAYAGGDRTALTLEEKRGLSNFARVGCMQCHWGPRLTDDAFHVTRLATGRADGLADPGRSEGITKLQAGEFLGTGRWSDAPARGRPVASLRGVKGAFKTPALRGVAVAAPYGHGGTEADLVRVTEAYGLGGLPAGDARTTGDLEPWLARFDVLSQWAIPPFLATLTAEPIVP